jgi:outer membrane protein insertion porin family
MLSNLLIILGLLFVTGVTNLFGQEGYNLDNLYFYGNESFSDEELTSQTSLFTLSWFEKAILRKDKFVFSEEYLEADIKKLIFFYQQQGFLQIDITYQYLDLDHENRSMDLEIIFSENEEVAVGQINYLVEDKNQKIIHSVDYLFNNLSTIFQLQAGQRFQDSYLETDKELIIKNLLNAGYAYVEVEADISLSNDEKNVEIIWKIIPGPVCYFGLIQIFSDKDVSESLILDRIEFKTGDRYKKNLLDTTQKSIYSLTLFQVVSVTAILEENKTHIIPVKITVKEAPTITTRFGVGYGSEAKFRVFADIIKSSFLGGTRRLNLLLSHSQIEPYNVDLRFIQPSFLTRALVLVINPFMRKQDEPGFKLERKGVKATFLYSFISKITSSLAYTYEDVVRDTIDNGFEDKLFDERYRGLYDKSMINLGLTRDTSFPMFSPNRGLLTSINFQYNGVITPVEDPFHKTLLDVRTYQKISAVILALRLKFGGILPIRGNDFIPVEERFYSGGSYSVRGWARQELGPKDPTGQPAGGKSLIEFSSEFRYPIYDIVRGVAFMDCGNVWIPSYTWPLNEIRYSLGLGIRIKTPIGPIRLDVARPVFDEENAIQFHFSVGNAF